MKGSGAVQSGGTVWITGAAGFTGRYLVRFLSDRRPDLRLLGVDTAEAGPAELDAYHRLDLADPEAITVAVRYEPPGWIIHLAGRMPPAPEPDMWLANVAGTIGLLTGLRKSGVRPRVVNVGSAAECEIPKDGLLREDCPGPGPSVYGRTKWTQTLAALSLGKQWEIPVLVARPFNLVGPGLPTRLVAGALCAQFADPGIRTIRVGNLDSRRDFLDVRDAVRAYWLLAEAGRVGEVYNVGSGEAVSVRELLDLLQQIAGRAVEIEVDPSRVRPGDPSSVSADVRKLREEHGWSPSVPLIESLREMVAHA